MNGSSAKDFILSLSLTANFVLVGVIFLHHLPYEKLARADEKLIIIGVALGSAVSGLAALQSRYIKQPVLMVRHWAWPRLLILLAELAPQFRTVG